MLTVLIEARDDVEALALTLSTLVGGAVEGIVREVMVHLPDERGDAARVADHAGCTLVPAGALGPALERARGEWLLIVEPGARLVDGWTDAARLHAEAGMQAASFKRARAASGGGLLQRLISRPRPLEAGLLLPLAEAARRAKGAGSVEAIARGVRPVRIAGEIIPASPRAS